MQTEKKLPGQQYKDHETFTSTNYPCLFNLTVAGRSVRLTADCGDADHFRLISLLIPSSPPPPPVEVQGAIV